MAIWFIIVGMTVTVVAVLLVPFQRKSADTASSDADCEAAIYRDQLAELERDHARGLIGDADTELARNEISRRLLQTTMSAPVGVGRGGTWARAAVLLVPLIALPLYAKVGKPYSQDVPLQERLSSAIANQDFDALVATVESHLAQNPNDIKGWQVLAPAYKRDQRWADAANAFGQVLRLAPANADVIADYAEMLVFANEGMVTAEAQKAFEQALKANPGDPRGRFYTALAVKQEGNAAEARKLFESFLADSPGGASWRPMVENELRQLSTAKAPTLSQDQIAAVQAMPAGDQATMIKSMIDGLEARLGSDSRDLAGWLRLIRARSVSKDIEKAKTSLQTATNIFKNEPASLEALNGLAKELGLN
jgi:cytochrome c-type biogenesis protein CcmH